MYLCICHNVRECDSDKYHLIGTACGSCKQPRNKNVKDTKDQKDRTASLRGRKE
jgi:bacterioferritin-associated ferredoxin